ncbi:hypothetical protein [Filomicrobium sp.]|uniref:hypothetical protein n=1 Tax=Filomicrobium sp. TaxID=2024831 RepID=UPI00258D7E3E|nr:hypothetical protein [Filomicrobium sp.]MCV0371768.1 hypothetical protein [Filomicrobium sp.]
MDQTIPTFSANLYPKKRTNRNGKSLPNLKGYVAAHDNPDRQFNVAGWSTSFTNAKGVILTAYNGQVEPFARSDSARDKMRAGAEDNIGPAVEVNGMKLESGRFVLFESELPNGELTEEGFRRADIYGWWNDKGVIRDISGWTNQHEGGRLSVVGSVQKHWEREQDSPDAAPENAKVSAKKLKKMQEAAAHAEEPVFGYDAPTEERTF